MPKFKNYVFFNDNRYEPGDDVPEEILEFIDPNNIAEEFVPEGEEGYLSMSDKQLTALLKERGLATSGNRATKIERLEADDRGTE